MFSHFLAGRALVYFCWTCLEAGREKSLSRCSSICVIICVSVQLLQTKLYVLEVFLFLLRRMVTLLTRFLHSYILQGGKRWPQSQHFFLLCLSLNLSKKWTSEFNCSFFLIPVWVRRRLMPEWQGPFFWCSWGFFGREMHFPCSRWRPTGEQPVFFTHHKLAAVVGDWWLRILQVSVKLFTGCTWAMKLCQLVSCFRAAAIAHHQQMAFWSKIHLAWSPNFNWDCCVRSLFIVGGKKMAFTYTIFLTLG